VVSVVEERASLLDDGVLQDAKKTGVDATTIIAILNIGVCFWNDGETKERARKNYTTLKA
jgi:hypothetical protein